MTLSVAPNSLKCNIFKRNGPIALKLCTDLGGLNSVKGKYGQMRVNKALL